MKKNAIVDVSNAVSGQKVLISDLNLYIPTKFNNKFLLDNHYINGTIVMLWNISHELILSIFCGHNNTMREKRECTSWTCNWITICIRILNRTNLPSSVYFFWLDGFVFCCGCADHCRLMPNFPRLIFQAFTKPAKWQGKGIMEDSDPCFSRTTYVRSITISVLCSWLWHWSC